MRNRPSLLMTVFCLVLGGVAMAGPDESPATASENGTCQLKYKAARAWRVDLPAERFTTVSSALDFTQAGGPRFAVELQGDALAVDTDADGKTDVKVTGKEGFVRLATKGEKPFTYAVRLRNAGSGWHYAAGGMRVGKVGETRITLIDQNGDGRYDGYGEDAMIVGRSKSAAFLSRVVNVAGALHRIEVAPDGGSIRHAPYTGPSGTLDVASKWDAQAKLQSVIVKSADGAYSFDLARSKGGHRVPAGRYVLHGGKLGLGENVVRFTNGRAKAIDVAKESKTVIAAGAPLVAEFAYQRNGAEVVFDPATLRYFGRAGEAYTVWQPFGKSPEFTVTDSKKGTEIAKAIFTGC